MPPLAHDVVLRTRGQCHIEIWVAGYKIAKTLSTQAEKTETAGNPDLHRKSKGARGLRNLVVEFLAI